MAIVDYASLQASIANWLHRSDLTTVIPDFITLAESKLNGDLESRSMEVRTTLTCVAGTRTVALPGDMLEMKRLLVVDTDPAQVMVYKSPDELVADNAYIASYTDRPFAFTVIGPNLELSPTPDFAYPLELVYEQRIPSLSLTNTTNWLLTQQPNAYLFGALMQSVAFTQDESRLAVWQKKYDEAVESVNQIDWYSGSTMRVRTK